MKNRSALLVSLTLFVAMPCLYVASFMPLAYAHRRGMVTKEPAQYALYYYGLPMMAIDAYGPPWARGLLADYAKFLETI